MSLKKLGITFAVALFAITNASAQDPHFTQFYANPIYLNPAFAGARKCPQISTVYRNQYPEFAAFRTISAAYDQFVDALGGGIAVQVLDDNAGNGTLKITEISGAYAYHLTLSRNWSLNVALQAGVRQRTLDWSNLRFGDQIDNLYGFVRPTAEVPGAENVLHADIGSGFLLYSEVFYMGAAFHHMTEPDDFHLVEGRLPMKMTYHAGAQIPLGRRTSIGGNGTTLNPSILYQQQGAFQQLNTIISLTREMFTGGISYRHAFENPDAITALLGFTVDRLSIGYTYDFTLSDLSNKGGGAHEVSLSFQLPCKPKKKKYKTINCPKF